MPTDLPKPTQFYRLQADALSRAIKTGRERAAALSAPSSPGPFGNPGFGLNRTNPSVIETKIAWWAGEASRQTASRQKAGDLVRPDWEKIRIDLYNLSDSMARSTLAAFDAHLGQQALDAWEAWPVDTMLSRSLLYLVFDITKTVISGTLGSAAPYTPYIREAKVKKMTTSASTLAGVLAAGGTAADAQAEAAQGMVYRGGKRRKATPNWKMQFLRRDEGGKWRFDGDAFQAGKEAAPSPDRKKTKGHPYQDLMVKPAKNTADKIGAAAIAGALKGAP